MECFELVGVLWVSGEGAWGNEELHGFGEFSLFHQFHVFFCPFVWRWVLYSGVYCWYLVCGGGGPICLLCSVGGDFSPVVLVFVGCVW